MGNLIYIKLPILMLPQKPSSYGVISLPVESANRTIPRSLSKTPSSRRIGIRIKNLVMVFNQYSISGAPRIRGADQISQPLISGYPISPTISMCEGIFVAWVIAIANVIIRTVVIVAPPSFVSDGVLFQTDSHTWHRLTIYQRSPLNFIQRLIVEWLRLGALLPQIIQDRIRCQCRAGYR